MASIQATELRCEYQTNPIGVDGRKPRFGWQIVGEGRGLRQTAYRLQVALEEQFVAPLWDTGKRESGESVHIEYGGPALTARLRYFYRVKVWDGQGTESDWSAAAFWETGLLRGEEWVADWITAADETPETEPAMLLRRELSLRGTPVWARLYAIALGVYEVYLNGDRVGDLELAPGWTSYSNRLLYQTYDVTAMLEKGDNAIGVTVGNGWYRGHIGWEKQRNVFGDHRGLLLQLHVRYADGTEDVICSDQSWSSCVEGPIRLSELYHGETYDARLEQRGWSMPGFAAPGWTMAVALPLLPTGELLAQENEPMRVRAELSPIEVIHTPKGETVLDFGQNMVGRVRFTVVGASAGTVITLRHAEVLDKEGNLYLDNLRKAKQLVTYICRGEAEETYEPHHTFQGFRYVSVEGYPGELKLDRFVGRVIHSDMESTGRFECSNPLLERLQSNIVWGQLGNFLDVPTDCPQRDERLGWTGDAQVFVRTAAFNRNVASFFAKWLRDLKADQKPNGGVPHVIPDVLGGNNHSSAAWGDAAVICPWTIYLCYGDTRVLADQYDSMKAWVDYIRAQGSDEFLWNTGFHFGDWLGLDAKENSYVGATPRDLIATAFFAYSAGLVAKAAAVLGKREEAAEYRALREAVVQEFHREFITPRGRIAAPTQTAHVLALMFDLVEGDVRERTVRELVAMIRENKDHLTTGFVGTPYLCLVLTENGYHDVAAKLVQQTSYPSWLYSVSKGATTIWEHWDGIKEDGSFWSANMNSFNHYAYGSVGDWMYRMAAGIDLDEEGPGYKRTVLKPRLVEGLSYARAAYRSLYGEIRSGWERDEAAGLLRVEVEVAPNTTATLLLSEARLEDVIESGVSLAAIGIAGGSDSAIAGARQVSNDGATAAAFSGQSIAGIGSIAAVEGGLQLELGSGVYRFAYPLLASAAAPATAEAAK